MFIHPLHDRLLLAAHVSASCFVGSWGARVHVTGRTYKHKGPSSSSSTILAHPLITLRVGCITCGAAAAASAPTYWPFHQTPRATVLPSLVHAFRMAWPVGSRDVSSYVSAYLRACSFNAPSLPFCSHGPTLLIYLLTPSLIACVLALWVSVTVAAIITPYSNPPLSPTDRATAPPISCAKISHLMSVAYTLYTCKFSPRLPPARSCPFRPNKHP